MRMQKFLRRKYQTLALLAIVAILFYLLQCFTVSKLGQLSSKRSNSWIGDGRDDGADFDHDDDYKFLFKGRNRVVDSDTKFHMGVNKEEHFDNEDREFRVDHNKLVHLEKELNIQNADSRNNQRNSKSRSNSLSDKNLVHMSVDTHKDSGIPLKNQEGSKDLVPIESSVKLLGVHPNERQMYKVDRNGLFLCLSSPEIRISIKQINDDFCDCPDSSDEPGTSACPHSKFYCTKQILGSPPQFIESSKVNDGICDCCDGSDELNGALVPDYMRIRDGEPQGAVYHAPCSDKCGEIVALRQAEDAVRSQGRKMQKKYLQKAAEFLTEAERQSQVFGPNGIFYLLSTQCFNLKVKEYEYEVCPFVKVTQQAFPHPPVILGRNHRVTLDKGQHLLIMDGGDNNLCPFGRGRKSKIYFLCGLKDTLMRVTESELCEYTFTMSSPAAC